MVAKQTDTSTPALSEILRSVPLFAGLPSESSECFDLLARGRVETREWGEALVTAGAQSDFLVIVRGAAMVQLEPPVPLRAGDHVGELDVCLGRPATANVRTTDASLIFRLSASDFLNAVDKCCGIAAKLAHIFARRLEHATQSAAGERP